MKFDSQRHHRRSIRLKGYGYAEPGAYFITVVTFQRDCLFGEIADGEMRLNDHGQVVDECWRAIPGHFTNVELGAYVVMPNHVHGIIVIHEDKSLSSVGARHASPLRSTPRGFERGSLGAIVASFKSAVTRDFGRKFDLHNVWQRNYYEHIIRDEKERDRIHRYIESNPTNWDSDNENLTNK